MDTLCDKLEVLRVVSHPVRIRILGELTRGVKCVGDFEKFLGISQPNTSQHLSLMRKMGVIDYYVEGRQRCYFLVDSMIPDLLELLEKDHSGFLPPPSCCPVKNKGRKEKACV